MKENKGVLITIIVLLIIFLPLTFLGYTQNLKTVNNSDKKLHHNGYMWFYDDKGELLSKYECVRQNCDYAISFIDDDKYKIKYFADGDKGINSVINNKYVFINDGKKVVFYSIENDRIITTYKNMKNYNTSISNNEYFLENYDGLWGSLKVSDDMMVVIPFEYNFIGLSKQFNESGKLMSDYYLVSKDNQWYIIDKNNNIVTNKYSDISDYRVFPNNLAVVTTNNLDIYDNNGNVINTYVMSNEYKDLEITIENNILKVVIDGVEKYNVELTSNIW